MYVCITDVKSSKTASTASKTGLDRISEGSESLTSKSEPTYKEKVKSIRDLTSESMTMSKEDGERTEEIEEDIISAASDDKSKEIKIDLKQSERQDLFDVSVLEEGSYTEDFVSDMQTTTRHDRLNLSTRSLTAMSEDVELKTAPHSARSVTEAITEQISENLQSIGGDESFSHKIDLKSPTKLADDEKSEPESDMENSRYSNVESSRPSSGKSERSSLSMTEHESSESEKSPKLSIQPDLDFDKLKIKPAQVYHDNLLDIDDLLGPVEDLTPLPSEGSTPNETPRLDSEVSKSSNFYEPMSEFNIGDRVTVTGVDGERVVGTLLFRGNVKFAPGVWAGIELDTPDGRHNGLEDGDRYFTCKDKHGLIVPGHDVQSGYDDGIIEEDLDLRESMSSVNTEDGDLQELINQAARNIEETYDLQPEQTEQDRNTLADRITDDLLESVLKQDLNTISNIANRQADRKKGPPVAPKPSKKGPEQEIEQEEEEEDEVVSEREQQPLRAQSIDAPEFRADRNVNDKTDSTMTNLMNDAIEHMLDIRNKNRQSVIKVEVEEGEEEDEDEVSPASPTDEIQGVIDKTDEDEELPLDVPFRPGSPIPGLQTQKVRIVSLILIKHNSVKTETTFSLINLKLLFSSPCFLIRL